MDDGADADDDDDVSEPFPLLMEAGSDLREGGAPHPSPTHSSVRRQM